MYEICLGLISRNRNLIMILLLICCKMNHVILHTILLATLAKQNDYKKFVCKRDHVCGPWASRGCVVLI